jgi:hypothetical protein
VSKSKSNGHVSLTAEELSTLKPLSAGDYYWAKQNAPRTDGAVASEDFAFFALAHAAKRKGLVDSDDVYAFLDRVDLPVLAELAGEMTEAIKGPSGPLAKTRTTSSRRSATSGE